MLNFVYKNIALKRVTRYTKISRLLLPHLILIGLVVTKCRSI